MQIVMWSDKGTRIRSIRCRRRDLMNRAGDNSINILGEVLPYSLLAELSIITNTVICIYIYIWLWYRTEMYYMEIRGIITKCGRARVYGEQGH